MNRRLHLATFATALSLAAVVLFGCSSDDNAAPAPTYSCTTKGPCPSDPVPSAEQAASCMTLSSDAVCGAAFKAYSACAFQVAICTDAGLSDPTADSTSSACNSEYATYSTCLTNKINDAGAGDGD